jgi:hypothetical protein
VQVVLDTNVLVSGLAFPSGPPGRIVSAWRAGAFGLVASEFMLDELARILPALSHRTGFSAADVRDFLDLMRAMSAGVRAKTITRASAVLDRLPPVKFTLTLPSADCTATLLTSTNVVSMLRLNCSVILPPFIFSSKLTNTDATWPTKLLATSPLTIVDTPLPATSASAPLCKRKYAVAMPVCTTSAAAQSTPESVTITTREYPLLMVAELFDSDTTPPPPPLLLCVCKVTPVPYKVLRSTISSKVITSTPTL